MKTEFILPMILAAVLLFDLIRSAQILRSGRHVLVVAFFAFATACNLFSTLYWIAYDFLRQDARMPFAANEICEWALFLLLASSLRAAFVQGLPLKKMAFPAFLFAAANAALWIAWSGEWVEDILTGISLGWYFCVLTACLLESDTLRKTEWIGIAAVAFLLIAAQSATFFAPDSAQGAISFLCTVLVFAVEGWLMLKTFLALRKNEYPKQGLSLSFAAYAWSTVAMYMNDGWIYNAALFLASVCYLMMLLAIVKEVAAE